MPSAWLLLSQVKRSGLGTPGMRSSPFEASALKAWEEELARRARAQAAERAARYEQVCAMRQHPKMDAWKCDSQQQSLCFQEQ